MRPVNDSSGTTTKRLPTAVAMITDLQGICRELRQAVERLAVACRGIEHLDPKSPHPKEYMAAVAKLQHACGTIGPCMQKLHDCASRYGG
jgi:hypothetical protein